MLNESLEQASGTVKKNGMGQPSENAKDYALMV